MVTIGMVEEDMGNLLWQDLWEAPLFVFVVVVLDVRDDLN
jgi:hypothetical protein